MAGRDASGRHSPTYGVEDVEVSASRPFAEPPVRADGFSGVRPVRAGLAWGF
jgi:hypothetical protein